MIRCTSQWTLVNGESSSPVHSSSPGPGRRPGSSRCSVNICRTEGASMKRWLTPPKGHDEAVLSPCCALISHHENLQNGDINERHAVCVCVGSFGVTGSTAASLLGTGACGTRGRRWSCKQSKVLFGQPSQGAKSAVRAQREGWGRRGIGDWPTDKGQEANTIRATEHASSVI